MVTTTKTRKPSSSRNGAKPKQATARTRKAGRNDSAPGQQYIEEGMAPEIIPDLETLGNEHKNIIRKRRELAEKIDPLREQVTKLLHENDLKIYECQESRAIFSLEQGEELKVAYPRGRPAGEA